MRVDDAGLHRRARLHAALADAARLAIVDELSLSDRAPVELSRLVGVESNLLAHHLDVLERAGIIQRSRSSGDGRRRYVHLIRASLADVVPARRVGGAALFVCTANSARSQLAAAIWRERTGRAAASAGTHPAPAVHPGALAVARSSGLELSGAAPSDLAAADLDVDLVVTVCDRAHEELAEAYTSGWLHWSVPDPVPAGTSEAFQQTVLELDARITALAA